MDFWYLQQKLDWCTLSSREELFAQDCQSFTVKPLLWLVPTIHVMFLNLISCFLHIVLYSWSWAPCVSGFVLDAAVWKKWLKIRRWKGEGRLLILALAMWWRCSCLWLLLEQWGWFQTHSWRGSIFLGRSTNTWSSILNKITADSRVLAASGFCDLFLFSLLLFQPFPFL